MEVVTARVYRDYQRDRVGWFFGLTGLQLGVLAAGSVPVAYAVHLEWWSGAFASLLGWGLLLILVVVPVRGRSAVGWALASLIAAASRATGHDRWSSLLANGAAGEPDVPDLPAPLHRIRVRSQIGLADRLGLAVVENAATRTWSVVASIPHRGLDWLADEERDQQASGLSTLLDAASATNLVSELQVLVRVRPDDDSRRANWLTVHRAATAPRLVTKINDDLQRHLTPAAVQAETFLILRIPERSLAHMVRKDRVQPYPRLRRGGLSPAEDRPALSARVDVLGALTAEFGQLAKTCLSADVEWLSSEQLAQECRAGYHPDTARLSGAVMSHATEGSGDRSAGRPRSPSLPWAAAGPANAVSGPRWYSHDGWRSASLSILLPARGSVVGSLGPVLRGGAAGERRCLLVGFPIVGAAAAGRSTASREWAADLGEGLRTRAGVRPRARERADQTTARGVDAKLVAGAALCRPYAIATTTVPVAGEASSPGTSHPSESIGAAVQRLEGSVRQAGFASQRLDLAHDSAFAAGCLPLGHTLDSSRGTS